MAVIPSGFLGATVALGREVGAEYEWTATGFHYFHVTGPDPNMPDRLRGYSYVVTNRHVVAGKESLQVRVDRVHGGAAVFEATLVRPDGSPHVVVHPDNDVDVAIIPINLGAMQAQCGDVPVFRSTPEVSCNTTRMRERGVFEGDSVFVIGFPMGMVGTSENGPIVRGGVISRITSLLAGQESTYLIDAEVFPGNSGGPVILRPSIMSVSGTKSNDRALLIGIVSSYVPYEDFAVSRQTGLARISFVENSGLTVVHPIDAVESTVAAHLGQMPSTPSPEEEEDVVTPPDHPEDPVGPPASE